MEAIMNTIARMVKRMRILAGIDINWSEQKK